MPSRSQIGVFRRVVASEGPFVSRRVVFMLGAFHFRCFEALVSLLPGVDGGRNRESSKELLCLGLCDREELRMPEMQPGSILRQIWLELFVVTQDKSTLLPRDLKHGESHSRQLSSVLLSGPGVNELCLCQGKKSVLVHRRKEMFLQLLRRHSQPKNV